MFDVAIAFPNNPKEEDDKIKEADTDPFQVKADLSNVHDLSQLSSPVMLLCSLRVFAFIHCGTFTSTFVRRVSKKLAVFPLTLGFFVNEVDGLKEAKRLEVHQVNGFFSFP